jgi:enoyl-CoA hydratase/carnithine racemase
MDFVNTTKDNNLAIVRLERGKVHALNDQVVEELHETFNNLVNDDTVKAVILTGTGKFFSFGFDIPGFMDHTPDEFTRFVTRFTDLATYMFLYPRPIIAAINGHAIAGGCILTLTADYRIMIAGKAKISLNEITFGSSIFAGSVEMLKASVGHRNAERILITGDMYSAEEAHEMGLVDQVTSDDKLMDDAKAIALKYSKKEKPAYVSLKNLLRKPVADDIIAREPDSIREFIKIWYSDRTREYLKNVKIRS